MFFLCSTSARESALAFAARAYAIADVAYIAARDAYAYGDPMAHDHAAERAFRRAAHTRLAARDALRFEKNARYARFQTPPAPLAHIVRSIETARGVTLAPKEKEESNA